MEAHYRAFNGRLVIKVEGTTIKDLFKQIGPVAEVLDGDNACGKCSSPNIYPRVREAQGFDFYELVCSDCGAKLSFGQHKDGGTMWPKRTDDSGNTLDHRGWRVYQALPPAPQAPPPSSSAPQPPSSSAAPRPVPVNSTAAPAVSDEVQQRLNSLVERCRVELPAAVFGEVCDALEGVTDRTSCDRAWDQAVRKHGNPIEKPAAIRPVLLDLLVAIERETLRMRRRTA